MNGNDEKLKAAVRERYTQIVKSNVTGCGCGCGTSLKTEEAECCSDPLVGYTIPLEEYKDLKGYVADADLGLGCGVPTRFAAMKPGDTVLDLGSGAGNDVFVARAEVGAEGFVIGVDMTTEMINKAVENQNKLGYKNVEFRLGEIENLPVENDSIDVVISNCVLNLVPDKQKAFSEMYRVIKPNGHFCISDIVLIGKLPKGLEESAAMYAGCISGAMQQEEYIAAVSNAGFSNVEIKKSSEIVLPENLLNTYLSAEELAEYKINKLGIYSITVTGNK